MYTACSRVPDVFLSFALIVMSSPAFAQPVMLRHELEHRPTAGKPFEIQYAVRWEGEPDAYLVEPLVADASEDWDVVQLARDTAFRNGDLNEHVFSVQLQSNEPGPREVPGMTVAYFMPVGDEESPAKEILYTDAFTLDIAEPVDRRIAVLAAVAVTLTGLAGLALWRSRRRGTPVTVSGPRDDSFAGALHSARAHRLDGDYYAFYQELTRAAAHLSPGEESKALRQRLSEQAKAVGFQARMPTPDELDGDLRDLERLHSSTAQQDS